MGSIHEQNVLLTNSRNKKKELGIRILTSTMVDQGRTLIHGKKVCLGGRGGGGAHLPHATHPSPTPLISG